MSKAQDPFQKFKEATLSQSPSIKNTIEQTPAASPQQERLRPSKADSDARGDQNKEQVSFFLDKDLKQRFGLLKFELGVKYNILYEEAIADLLRKYHKL